MKKVAWLIVMVFAVGYAFADSVIMKDGLVIEGKIIEKTSDSVIMKTRNGEQEIDRHYIKRIIRTEPVVTASKGEESELGVPWQDAAPLDKEGSVKLVFDMKGTHAVSGSVNGAGFTGTEVTNEGLSLAGDYTAYIKNNIGLGCGAILQLPRKQSNIAGNFYFLPFYGLVKLRTAPDDDRNYKYLVGHLGYNFFDADNTYKGTNATMNGGLYYAAGAGLNSKHFQVELLYSASNGSVKQSGLMLNPVNRLVQNCTISRDVTYSKLSLSVNVSF